MADEVSDLKQLHGELDRLRARVAELEDDSRRLARVEADMRVHRDLARRIGQSGSLNEAVECVLDAAVSLDGVDSGGFYVIDDSSGRLRLVSHRGLSPAFVAAASDYPADSERGRMVLAGTPIHQAYCDYNMEAATLSEGLRAVAAMPIRHGGRTVGCLNIASHTVQEFGPDQRRLLETIADSLGGVIARLRHEQARLETERRYGLVFERSNVGIALAGGDGRIIESNPAFQRLLGYTGQELAQMTVADFTHPDDLAVEQAMINGVRAGGRESYNIEKRYIRKDGQIRWVRLHASAVTFEAGGAVLAIGLVDDITEHKQIEADLRRSEARNRALINAIPDVMYSISRDGVYGELVSARGFEPVFPWTQYYQGRRVSDIVPPNHARTIEAIISEVFATGQVRTFEYQLVDPRTNEVRHREARYSVSGPDELLCLTRDITDRKRMEQELLKSDAKHRGLLQAIPDTKFRLSGEGVFLEFIPGLEPPARDPREFIGRNIAEVLPPAIAQPCLHACREAIRTRQTQTLEYRLAVPLPDGPINDYEARLAPAGPDEVIVLVRNITDRKRMENELQTKLAENRALIRAIPDQMIFISRDGVYLDVVHEGQFAWTMDPRSNIGKTIWQALPPALASDLAAALAAAFSAGATNTFDYSVCLSSGETRYREVRVIPIDHRQAMAVIRDVTDRRLAEQQLRSLASQLSLAEERERRRIAGELHDHIGQALALAKIQLGQVRNTASGPASADGINNVLSLIEQTIRDTRSLTFELSPPILYELGFEPAVEWLAEQVEQQYGVPVEVHSDDSLAALGDDVRIVLFQAVRELLINAAKHASPTQITVTIMHEPGRISVQVADDGRGFDPTAIDKARRGFGLFSIRERLAALGGRLSIDSAPAKGARIEICAPAA